MDKEYFGITPSVFFNYGGEDFKNHISNVEISEKKITYTLDDGLIVETHIKLFPEEKLIWWTNYFINPTDKESQKITDVLDCVLEIPFEPDPVPTRRQPQRTWEPNTLQIIETRGANVKDDDYFQNSKRIWENSAPYTAHCEAGRSGLGTAPFFDINRGNQGVIIAIGWTGQWNFTAKRNHDNVQFSHGMTYSNFKLKPGESLRTSSTAALLYDNGQNEAHNRFRSFMRNISPLGDKGRGVDTPFSAIFWGGVSSEELIGRWENIIKAGLPFDTCWVDAGWYEPLRGKTCVEQTGEWPVVGTWEVNKVYHPDNYKDVVSFLRKHNIKFMLWFEPERVSDLVSREIKLLKSSTNNGSKLVALNEEEVLQETCKFIGDRIEEIGVDVYRQDANFFPLDIWLENDEEDMKGSTEIRYINNLYRFWDYLLERFPNLLIDNCAGGGHRNDIEMLSRAVPMWRSDYQCTWNCLPEGNQIEAQGAAWWIPYSGIGYGPDLGDLYSFRSAYTNGLTIRTWEHVDPEWNFGATNEPIDWAKKYFAEYLSVRHYFAMDFYPLVPNTMANTVWCASQYHDPQDDTGIILAFRRGMCPNRSAELVLSGLKEDKNYEFLNIDTGEKIKATGKDAMTRGILFIIEEKRSSHIWKYKQLC